MLPQPNNIPKKTKMTWLSWDKVCTPKEEGGLGFHNLKAFNFALLVKQGWRFQANTSSLVYRVLKARYFLDSDFLGAKLGSHPSYAWRSVLAAQNIIGKGVNGKWVMELQLIFGQINGLMGWPHLVCLLDQKPY